MYRVEEDDEDSPRNIKTIIKSVPCRNPKASTFSVTFPKFRKLLSEGFTNEVHSTNFSSFGQLWRLHTNLDDEYSSAPKGLVAIRVECMGQGGPGKHYEKAEKMKITFEVKSEDGTTSLQMSSPYRFWGSTTEWCGLSSPSDVKRRFLDDRALKIYVTLELKEFIPKNPLAATMLKLFGNVESSNVTFEIIVNSDNDTSNKGKRGKSTNQYHAHRFILEHASPELAALCESSPEGGMESPILINDIKPCVFRHLLWYIYGGNISQGYFLANAKSLIDAADKYGVVNLKLEAEVWYVHATKLSTNNLIDNLLYADAKNLALLKEAVMDYTVKNKKKVIKKVSFENVPGNIYKDLLMAVSRVLDESDEDDSDNEEEEEGVDYSSMGIGVLRRKLDQKGVDIDGSRDTLIAALKEQNKH